MKHINLDTAHLSDQKVRMLLDKLPYISEEIIGLSYEEVDNVIQIIINDNSLSREVRILQQGIDDLLKQLTGTRFIKSKVVKSNEVSTIEKDLPRIQNPKSLATFKKEKDLNLLGKIDNELLKIARKYEAQIREYPIFLNADNMDINQYHLNFPQNVFGVGSVAHNHETIIQYKQDAAIGDHSSLMFNGQFLRPCLCYHSYEELQGDRITSPKIFTSQGQCFRHEVDWKKDNFRKSEFSMREIVFIGEEDWVCQTRDLIMKDVWSLFDSIGLIGKIVTATDPFFFSDDLKTKAAYQLMSKAKYELVVVTTEGKESSIASFNYCEDVLCDKYEIKDMNQKPLYSGCIAFGLDRWKEAITDKYGYSDEPWILKEMGAEVL
ncbi:hypothetical protein PQ478_21635 (plasmid) [Alkalihalophilus pseudofirmus]|uniref:hypothetical protein n=1 Tax=Alkalihalophilus pseudofirmus TaxID=79885 RepID=UPI00259B4E2E|nr:hypothetical protein [Alkalihalophilus pseudofirmus]WEG19160.1 hypothetical protein PQ478_21635 [Alkalihalophilus pseudofirmus]